MVNERTGHVVVSDLRRHHPYAPPEQLQALQAFKMEIDVLFEGTHVVSGNISWTWKYFRVEVPTERH